jgi:hypothetical protein
MHEHTFKCEEVASKKYKAYKLYGYPKRYKKPKWKHIQTDTTIAYLLQVAERRFSKKEPYFFKIVEVLVTSKFTPVTMERLMLERIKQGI